MPCPCRETGQPARRGLAPAGGLTPERAHDHPDRRERRADRLAIAAPGRHRRGHGHERAALPDDRDPHRAQGRGCFTVVGGPWVTVQEDYFDDLADVIFIGEAEETWPRFLADWQDGRHAARYEQAEKTDMTRVPIPRFDLLKMGRYAFGSLQFSRGCPFQCEFCDIIVTFGRRPRLKTGAQVIAELEAIRRTGQRIVFIVNDNLIGNKKAIKAILREVIAWQQRNGYPLSFFTEASIDLADDPELMAMMAEADFIAVFVGIESPDEESLREAKKYQNVRAGGTMLEKVHRIQEAGMEVWCGMIMGFDSDDTGIFDRQVAVHPAGPHPVRDDRPAPRDPQDPAVRALLAEGRLDLSDRPEFVTNIRPLKMSPEELPTVSPGHDRAVRSRELLRPHRGPLPSPGLRDRLRESSSRLLAAAPAPLCLDAGEDGAAGHRLVSPADEPGRAGLPAPRVSQAALAVPESPPPPRPDALLPVPYGDALSCPHHGADDGRRRARLVNSF